MTEYSIGEVSAATGVGQSTLRMWEQRHAFPTPNRKDSGHRRYSQADVEALERIVALRRSGLSLAVAVERSRTHAVRPRSIYATLRAKHPELWVHALPKRLLLPLTRAIEDETCARAERPVMFGCFQRERFYRREQHRWRQFSATAEFVCVFADFKRKRAIAGAPLEIPLQQDDHLEREWAIVCDAPGYCVCLSAWEPPQDPARPDASRTFEAIWSVEPAVVRTAIRTCASIAEGTIPDRIDLLRSRLDASMPPPADEQLRLAAAITGRTLAALA